MSERQVITKYEVYPPSNHIDPAPFFSQPDARQEKLFQHRMLSFPLRNIVITKIKDPLRKALVAGKSFPRLVLVFFTIVATAWRIRKYVGKVTKQNSVYKNVHCFLDLAELLKQCHHNPDRELMVNSFLEIGAAILEHDSYYRGIAYRMAFYIHKKIEAGEWILDLEPFPKELSHCWDDNVFLGGLTNANTNE